MTLFTRHDRMKRIFSRSAPKELLTDPQSSGGSYRLTSSADLIAYHRRLKRGSPWPARIHRLLTFGLVLSFLGILCGVWFSAFSAQGSPVSAEASFTVAVWASVVFAGLVLAKCWWNARYPQN